MSEKISFSNFRLRSLVVIVAVLCLSIIFFISLDITRAKIRDIKRRADIKIIAKGLDLYYDKYGRYPESVNDWRGWDLTYEYMGGELIFLKILKDEGFVDRMVSDPINDAVYHYRYQKYEAGAFGCNSSFYILQVTNFELPSGDIGAGECGEFSWTKAAPNGYTVQAFD